MPGIGETMTAGAGSASDHGEPEVAAVRAQLDRILDSPGFRATPKRRALLRHLVEETLAGRGELLKGFTIAVAVFDRDASFDSQTDPVVRLEARRLRTEIDAYYGTAGAGRAVVGVDLGSQPAGLQPHDRIGLAVEARVPVEDRHGDGEALQQLAPAGERLLDQMAQQRAPLRRGAEARAVEDAVELRANGGDLGLSVIGGAPRARRHRFADPWHCAVSRSEAFPGRPCQHSASESRSA